MMKENTMILLYLRGNEEQHICVETNKHQWGLVNAENTDPLKEVSNIATHLTLRTITNHDVQVIYRMTVKEGKTPMKVFMFA